MFHNGPSLFQNARQWGAMLALWAISTLAAAMCVASAMAALGQIPWPSLPVNWGNDAWPDAGMWMQVGLTLLLLCLCFFLPANARMARLERSHRSFQIGMEDVKRAYALAHAADRTGVFTLSSEFESVRQRMDLLRRHPDLSELEPELLELAAQMSFQSRDLARAYSDEKVQRAREFLRARQSDADQLAERIRLARMTSDELRRWLTDVEAEERRNLSQIRRLEADRREILPALGYAFEDPRDANVLPLALHGPKGDGLH